MNEDRLKKRYQRERAARQDAESLLEQKSLELFHRNQELETFKQGLEQQVIERTKEAERAKTEAFAANQAKSQFLANMSHEIRTPLTAIIGFAEVLLQHKLDHADNEKYLTTIIRSGRHLTALLGEILDLSKIENQKLELDIIRFNLPSVLQDIEQIYQLNCQKEQLEFNLVMDSVIPQWIEADPTRLKQVIHNLLNNSIKFTKSGEVNLHITFLPNKSALQIDVVDTGEGIAEDKQAIIFESFRQADTSITRNFGGTGLGLFITKSLVELMGGGISVESQIGVGSTFTVTILCQSFEGEYDPNHFKEMVDVQPEQIPTLSGSILLVEDTEINQHLITFNLQQTGASVDLAINGQEGLQKALANHYDLILMDIQMPVMDGKQAMKSIKQLGVNTPTYALTANIMPEDIQEYAEIGFTGTLSKPLELGKLFKVLKQHLTGDKPNSESTVSDLDSQLDDPNIKTMFYAELEKQHIQITENLQNVNYANLIKATHIIKGVAASFGYKHLTILAANCLQALRQKQYNKAVEYCANLNQEIADVLHDHNS